jgi:hypothetical protein
MLDDSRITLHLENSLLIRTHNPVDDVQGAQEGSVVAIYNDCKREHDGPEDSLLVLLKLP